MGLLASTTYQCGWQPKPEVAPSIKLSPAVLELKRTETPTLTTYKVFVDVYDGNELVHYLNAGFSTLSSNQNVAIAPGVYWGFGNEDGRFYYSFRYTGITDVNTDISFEVTYDGNKFPGTISLRSVGEKGEKGDPGESIKGDDGKNGVWVPPPMLWEDYPSDYVFKAGVPGVDDRLDVVLVKENSGKLTPYRCIYTHTKSNHYKPWDNAYRWQACDSGVWKFLATELLLASSARIDFLSGQAIRIGSGADVCGYFGAPMPSGAILYTGGTDESKATFIVFKEGRARWGDASGKRIELDPANGSMLVYDSKGDLCATYSGETIDYTKIGNQTGSNATTTIAANTMGRSLSGSSTYTVDLVSSATAPDRDGTLKITLPRFSITCYGELPQSESTTMMSEYKAELRLVVTVDGKAMTSPTLGYVHSDSSSGSSVASTYKYNIPAGKSYSVQLKYISNLALGGSTTFSTVLSATVALEVAMKLCQYASNGWCIASSNQNYAYCLMDSAGKMHFKVVSGGNVIFDSDTDGYFFKK